MSKKKAKCLFVNKCSTQIKVPLKIRFLNKRPGHLFEKIRYIGNFPENLRENFLTHFASHFLNNQGKN